MDLRSVFFQDALATAKAHQELLEQEVQEVLAFISYLDDEQLKHGSIHNIIKVGRKFFFSLGCTFS